jgi:hypothetical protein
MAAAKGSFAQLDDDGHGTPAATAGATSGAVHGKGKGKKAVQQNDGLSSIPAASFNLSNAVRTTVVVNLRACG